MKLQTIQRNLEMKYKIKDSIEINGITLKQTWTFEDLTINDQIIYQLYGIKGLIKTKNCGNETFLFQNTKGENHWTPIRCKYKYCKTCFKSWIMKVKEKAFETLYQDILYRRIIGTPKMYTSLLTLTLKKTNLLNDTQRIKRIWHNVKDKLKKERYTLGSGIYSIETGEKNDNVHIHAFLVGSGYIPQKTLLRIWKKYSKDSTGAYITGRKITKGNLEANLKSGIGYVIKYITKSIINEKNIEFQLLQGRKTSYNWIKYKTIKNIFIPGANRCENCNEKYSDMTNDFSLRYNIKQQLIWGKCTKIS